MTKIEKYEKNVERLRCRRTELRNDRDKFENFLSNIFDKKFENVNEIINERLWYIDKEIEIITSVLDDVLPF